MAQKENANKNSLNRFCLVGKFMSLRSEIASRVKCVFFLSLLAKYDLQFKKQWKSEKSKVNKNKQKLFNLQLKKPN